VWRAGVIFMSPNQMLRVDQGNHGINHHTNTPLSMVDYFYFKSFSNIFFPKIVILSTFIFHSPIKPNYQFSIQSYSLKLTTAKMSHSPNQTSPSNTSPDQTSPSKTTVPIAKSSDIITDAVPITMVHPSFVSALKSQTSKSSPTKPTPSPKPKSKKKPKTKTTQKPKSHKSKFRYSFNFDMQQLYLDDLGNASTNVASDVTTLSPVAQIEATV
jgi:hypothetical protein